MHITANLRAGGRSIRGGIAASTLDTAPLLVEKVRRLGRLGGRRTGVPLGSDVGGFSSLPGPDGAGRPLHYPFEAFRGHVFHSAEGDLRMWERTRRHSRSSTA